MAEKLLVEFKQGIESFLLIPSTGGRYEVTINGDLVYSKLKEGRFPEFEELEPLVKERL